MKYENDIKTIEKKDDFLKNKYEEHLKLGKIIHNTYSLHKTNYFNVKNMYLLMVIYYNNEDIYNNVVLKYINNSKDINFE